MLRTRPRNNYKLTWPCQWSPQLRNLGVQANAYSVCQPPRLFDTTWELLADSEAFRAAARAALRAAATQTLGVFSSMSACQNFLLVRTPLSGGIKPPRSAIQSQPWPYKPGLGPYKTLRPYKTRSRAERSP